MERARPGEAHRRLAAFAGTWTGKERLHPTGEDPAGGLAEGRIRARSSLGGFFLLVEYVREREGVPTYRAHAVLGWDAKRGVYTLHWFDNAGRAPPTPAWGRWEGQALICEGHGPGGFVRHEYVLEGADRLTYRMDRSADGTLWGPLLEGRYRKA